MNQKKFKLALVTGASSGIGEALCQLLASKGINLLITGRNVEKLDAMQQELSKQVQVTAFSADLSTRLGVDRVVEEIQKHIPDLVINNAGLGRYGEILDHTTQSQMNILEVNGNALLELTLESAKAMAASHIKGIILNVSSAGAFQIFPLFAVYTASKAFVNHLSISLDYELRSKEIRVLTSCPGMVDTQFGKRSGGEHKGLKTGVMPVTKAAEEIWWQICKGKQVHTFDFRYRFLTTLSQFIPNWLLARILTKVIRQRVSATRP